MLRWWSLFGSVSISMLYSIDMTSIRKFIHMVSETIAIVIIAPYMLFLAGKQSDITARVFLTLTAIGTFIVDGYLLWRWIKNGTSDSDNTERIRQLVRQTARWSVAARQDKNIMISVLHANYGAGYLWSLLDIFKPEEIEEAAGISLMKLKTEVLSVQDWATRRMSRSCNAFAPKSSYLAKLAGDI